MKRRDFLKGLLKGAVALPALAVLPALAWESTPADMEPIVTYNPQQTMEIHGVSEGQFMPGDMMIIDDGYTRRDYEVIDWDGENKFVLQPWSLKE